MCNIPILMPYTNMPTLNLLNAELNPICHLLAVLVAHHILHISGLGVNVTATSLRNHAPS
jgi:hypothetical protein